MVLKLESVEFTPNEDDNGTFPPIPPEWNYKWSDENMDNKNVTFKDLKISEQRLESKIEINVEKLSGKIDVLGTKIDAQNKLLYWIMGIISAGIIVPFLAMFIKTILK